VLVATVGLSVDRATLRGLRGAARPVLLILTVSTLLLPALAWAASRLVTDPALRDGVLAAGVAPAEVASVSLTALAGADAAVAAALLIGSTVATVVLAGPVLALLAGAATTSPPGLIATLALVIALPLGLGLAARARWPHARGLHTTSPLIATAALLVLVYLVAAHIPVSSAYLPVVPALLGFLAGSALLGALLSRGLPPPQRLGVLLPVGMRDFAVAAGIADIAFGPTAATPLGLYGVLVLLFGALTARVSRGRCR